MPDRRCLIYHEKVKGNNMRRYVLRWHMKSNPIDDDTTVKLSDAKVQELVTLPDRPTPGKVPVEYLRNAVLCMLSRLECNNIPALTKNLAQNFPAIPRDWHVPMIFFYFCFSAESGSHSRRRGVGR